ncbi:MAG: type IV pilus biogenesis protein PilP [Burkholderiaceae bacterium]|nr:type IV pilus biogenesis protein PilP [Burkholderiaceae bacterium]
MTRALRLALVSATLGTTLFGVARASGPAAAVAVPVPSSAPAPSPAPEVVAPAEVSIAGMLGRANADQLGQTAAVISRLRQQQAVVEAQAALAKAQQDLAKLTQPPTAPVPAPPLNLTVGLTPVRSESAMRLMGVSGRPDRRIALIEGNDGTVRELSAGQQIDGWEVREVRLNDVQLVRRGGLTAVLRLDGLSRGPAAAKASQGRKP